MGRKRRKPGQCIRPDSFCCGAPPPGLGSAAWARYQANSTPLTAQVVRTAGEVPTILATCQEAPARQRPYLDAGCQVLVLPERGGHVDLDALLDALGRQEVDGLLIEGGGALAWSALEQGLVQRVYAYLAPMLLGGEGAKSPVEGRGFPAPDQAVRLKKLTLTPLGADVLLEGEVM